MTAQRAYCLDLSAMKANILAGDYRLAITEGERFIAQDPHSDELYYLLGLCYLKDGNYLRASDIFEIIIKEFKGSAFEDAAGMGFGDTYFLRGDFIRARETYQSILKSHPETKLKAGLYYRISEASFKEGNSERGKEYLDKLNADFPLAPETRQSRLMQLPEKNTPLFYYSVQVGSFVNSANAYNLKNKLLNSGYSAYVEESVSGSGIKTFRVGAGKLNSRLEAEELNNKLIADGYPTKICP